MKTPKIIFKGSVLKELGKAGINKAEVKKRINDAVAMAEKISKKGLDRVDSIQAKKRRRRKKAWKRDSKLVTYFGSGSLTINQIRAVGRRLNRAHRRLSKNRLTIRVFPQSKAPKSTTNAQNLGSVFSPNTFKVFTRWFTKNGSLQRGGILLHELFHDYFNDQKLNGKTVYGEDMAKKLASSKPRKARRNAENYEWYSMRQQKPTGSIK